MGFAKEDVKTRIKMWRGLKTVFFIVTMLVSLLVFSAPTLLVIADALLPFSLLSASLYPSNFSIATLPSYLNNYDFRRSLVDIPVISIFRSAVILCVYSLCDGPSLSRGPYLGITTVCSVVSLVFVSLKAAYVFGDPGASGPPEVALFACSLVLAVGHIVVAYRTSCRERRKLLVYKIDIEALILENLNGVAGWVISTFFSSLECFSCVNISTFDPDDSDEEKKENGYRRQGPLPSLPPRAQGRGGGVD